MAKSSRGRLRRLWFDVHMWIGVGLFVVLIPLSVSGSYLVWREEIDRATHPERYAVTSPEAALPAAAYLASAQAAFGARADAASLRMPEKAGDPVTVMGAQRRAGAGAEGARGGERGREAGGRTEGGPASAAPQGQAGQGAAPARPAGRPRMLTAYVDPGTARVLAIAEPMSGVSRWMHDLHGQLFVPPMGRKIVGWLGWLMLVSCFTGVWLWWPKNGDLTKAFRWRRSPSTLLNLHYLTGFWVAIPLAVLSITGALISFPQFARMVVGPFAPVNAQAGRGGPPGFFAGRPAARTDLTVDEAVAKALAVKPGSRLVSVSLPTRGREGAGDWRVQVGGGGPPATVAVADSDGAAKLLPAPKAPPQGEQVLRLNRRLHDGGEMPLAWKLIITVAGLIPALLGVTGVIVWARRQLRKAAMRRRLTDDPTPSPSPAE